MITDDGLPTLQTHRATEWGYWYVANIFASATTGMSELFGWDNQEWLNDATRSAVQLQELFNKVKAERTGR